MFILPDGFLAQATEFEDDLDALKASRGGIRGFDASRTPVALASIVTGETPYVRATLTAGESRAVLKPNAPDIFEYAVSQGKSVGYSRVAAI